MSSVKRKTAFTEFVKDGKQLDEDKGEFFKRRAREYRELSPTKKEELKRRALASRFPTTYDEIKEWARKVMKFNQDACNVAKKIGVTFEMTIELGGTRHHISSCRDLPDEQVPLLPGTTDVRTCLLTQVQNIINTAYSAAVGKIASFPYTRHFKEPVVKITGFPVPFKRPHAYGMKSLKAILACMDDIKMQSTTISRPQEQSVQSKPVNEEKEEEDEMVPSESNDHNASDRREEHILNHGITPKITKEDDSDALLGITSKELKVEVEEPETVQKKTPGKQNTGYKRNPLSQGEKTFLLEWFVQQGHLPTPRDFVQMIVHCPGLAQRSWKQCYNFLHKLQSIS